MPNLYIIAGCNGAGKTTASYTVLPELLNCREFVNADNIAAGLSPFDPESVALEAGRIMLQRVDELSNRGVDFALTTTLGVQEYALLIKKAEQKGYKVKWLFGRLASYQKTENLTYPEITNTDAHKMSIDELEAKVLEGMRRANLKLVESAAANNESLIIGDKKGGFKAVPAKELLKTLPGSVK
ncbi:hypothetical protein [Mucilaginibacter celer]|uniref:hypothetical protein n=1 Tax=Mucilaginibacter celer TaxID=2305508 RepID=UPI001968D267|nr:hypothetical protein [Mucilaginibacter celer]